jgi:diguanylate cyclase (GGDEF)-like protein
MSHAMLLALLSVTAVLFGAGGFALGRRRIAAPATPARPAVAPTVPQRPVAPAPSDIQIEFASLERQVRRSRESGLPLTLVHLSVDQLDTIRDNHGVEAIDRVLRGVARAVRSQLRPGDLCVRDGADAFVVVVPNVGAERAPAVMARIEAAVRQHKFAVARGQSIRISVCQGAASLPEDGGSYDALLTAAETRRRQVAEARTGRQSTTGSLLRYAGRLDVTPN